MITIALGFAAFENVLYILKPGTTLNVTAGLLTGGLRFFGSTLLHVIASGFIGIVIGLSPNNTRRIFMILGLAGATFLHGTFNMYILKNNTASFLQIYGYLWVAAIISLIILEKLRRIPIEQVATS
jgi:RsiW-degrading membrane proteinase PrsW (M82 family)